MAWLTENRSKIVVGLVCLLIAAGLVFGKKLLWPDNKPTGTFTTPPPAYGMPATPTEEVKLVVPLKVYPKKEAVKKLKLPAEIADNPAKEITATAALKPTPGGYTVAAVTDTTTGVTELVAKEKPRSLFGFGGTSEVGAMAGITTKGDAGIIFVRQDLLRVGVVNFFAVGGAAVVGGNVGAGAFAGVSVKW